MPFSFKLEKSQCNLLCMATLVGVVGNVVLSLLVASLATSNQTNPPTGNAADLNLLDQIVHMFVHHKHVLLSSSLVVAAVVALSVYVATLVQNARAKSA
jgi:hypothetical protein